MLDLARELDESYSYVDDKEVSSEEISGSPWLRYEAWKDWDEPYWMSYTECVHREHAKDAAVYAVRDAVGRVEEFEKLDVFVETSVREHPLAMGLVGSRS